MPSQFLKLAYTILFSLFLISPELVYAVDFGLSLGYWDSTEISSRKCVLLEPQGDQGYQRLFSMAYKGSQSFILKLIAVHDERPVYVIQTNADRTQIRGMAWFDKKNRVRTFTMEDPWRTLNLLRVPRGGPIPDIWQHYHHWRLSPEGTRDGAFHGENRGRPAKYPIQARDV